MEQDGSKKIFLTKDSFNAKKKVGYSNKYFSIEFFFEKNLLKEVVIISLYEDLKNKSMSEIEKEDEEEILRFIKIRSRTNISALLKFIEPAHKKKVRTIKKRNIIVNNKSWQWGYKSYCKKKIKPVIDEYSSDEINLLFSFLGLTI